MTERLPTVAQMKARALSGHRQALQAIADGRLVLGPTARPSEFRGMRTVLATLYRWECLTPKGGLTERGRELLDALRGETVDAQ